MIVNQTTNGSNFTGSAQMRFYNPNGRLLDDFEVTKGVAGKIFDSIRNTKLKDEFIKHDIEFKHNQMPELGHVDDYILTGKTARERHEIGRKLRESGARIAQIAKDGDKFGNYSDLSMAHQTKQMLLGKYINNSIDVKADGFKDRIKSSEGLLELQVVLEQVKGKLKIIDMMFKKAGSDFKKRPIEEIKTVNLGKNQNITSKKIINNKSPRLRPSRAHGVVDIELPPKSKKTKPKEIEGQTRLFNID